jgi:rubrerythrin
MSTNPQEIVGSFFDELKISQQYQPYIQRATLAGYPQLAKVFQALVASETVREALFREKVPLHADNPCDFFVCPKCGLIYDGGAPEQCPACETPGDQFIVIR